MLDLALNRKDGDLVFRKNEAGFNELWLINGRDRIAQKIKIKLRFWLGEWFLNTNLGVPYLETIFLKGTRLATIELIIKTQILEVEGVTGIKDFTMRLDNATRLLSIVYSCTSAEGLVRDSVTLDARR